MQEIRVKRADVAQVVQATFPEYRGRKIRVVPATKVHIHGLNWDGGSRNRYRGCTLSGESTGSLDKYNRCAPWSNPAEGQTVELVPGVALVKHSIFCGHDTGLRIYVHPDSIPRLLAA